MDEATSMKPKWWNGWHTALLTIAITLISILLTGIEPSTETVTRGIAWEALSAIATTLAVIVALATVSSTRQTAFEVVGHDTKTREDAERRILATALMAELKVWLSGLRYSVPGNLDVTNRTPDGSATFIALGDFNLESAWTSELPIFAAGGARLGLFDPKTAEAVIQAYAAIRHAQRAVEPWRKFANGAIIRVEDEVPRLQILHKARRAAHEARACLQLAATNSSC